MTEKEATSKGVDILSRILIGINDKANAARLINLDTDGQIKVVKIGIKELRDKCDEIFNAL